MAQASLWQIFGVFAKIGAFTIGGGYAMIPVIESEMRRRNWIPADEIDDIVILAQSAPGLLAVNMAIFSGHKLRGIKGSIIATLGAIMPSFVIILAIAAFFTAFRDNALVQNIFKGMRPVAVALILVPAVQMAKNGNKNILSWLITIITVMLVAFMHISPIYILLVLIVLSVSYYRIKEGRR